MTENPPILYSYCRSKQHLQKEQTELKERKNKKNLYGFQMKHVKGGTVPAALTVVFSTLQAYVVGLFGGNYMHSPRGLHNAANEVHVMKDNHRKRS